MFNLLRIGIPVIGNWFGGFHYTENLAKVIARLPQWERPQLFLVITEETLPFAELYRRSLSLFDGTLFLQLDSEKPPELPWAATICQGYNALFARIDLLYPCSQALTEAPENASYATWIPDFQHVDLPQFFTEEERQERDAIFFGISVMTRLNVFISQHGLDKFRALYPDSPTILRALPFHVLPDDHWYSDRYPEVLQKYAIPERFLICTNQFWQHKDHLTLFRAIALLRDQGVDVHLVCTGTTTDYRNPDYFHTVKAALEDLKIQDRVQILGPVPREDQIQLVRCSLAMVQPSLYEGWNTSTEEGRTLGKTMVLSDFPVLVAQAPAQGIYFKQQDPQDLAAVLARKLPELQPGPDLEGEKAAYAAALELTAHYARQFCQVALEAQFIFSKKIPGMSPRLWELLSEPLTMESTPGNADSRFIQEPSTMTTTTDSHDVTAELERLRTQLRQTQIELVRAQSHVRRLKRELDESQNLSKVYEQAAQERLDLINQLHPQAQRATELEQTMVETSKSVKATWTAFIRALLRKLK